MCELNQFGVATVTKASRDCSRENAGRKLGPENLPGPGFALAAADDLGEFFADPNRMVTGFHAGTVAGDEADKHAMIEFEGDFDF